MSQPEVPDQFRSFISDDGTQAFLAGRISDSVPEWLGNLTNLTFLDLSGNRLTTLPESIGNLTSLTLLDLSGNRLTTLPDAIGNLHALTALHLDDNQLIALPDSISDLTNLTTLQLGGYRRTAIPDAIRDRTAFASSWTRGYDQIVLPEWIGNLSALSSLDLSGLRLDALPEWISKLGFLAELYLAGNRLAALPEWIGNLTGLTNLDLSGNHLTEVPHSIYRLTNLIDLRLDRNELTDLPGWIGDLNALKSLDLLGNRLTELPDSIGNLTSLTKIDLFGNRLIVLPDSIGNLTALTTLDLRGHKLFELPDSIGNLVGLTRLHLSGNRLQALPDSIGNLTHLIEFDPSYTELVTIPDSIGNLSGLTELDLSGNRLTSLPDSIGNLTDLAVLNLTGNQFTSLPDVVGNLTVLTTLILTGNRLTTLPESIGNLTCLTDLELTRNQLTTLPDAIGNLTHLTSLDLSGHQLTALPESIGSLTRLTSLNLEGNRLTRLPKQLANPLARGLHLRLADNPLADPLPELVGRGATALAAYLGSLEDAEAQYEAKLLLLGEGNVGKSSLVAALRGSPFVEDRPTTHGIEISQLKFGHPSRNVDILLHAWDFGGQEVYRVTHQFFFSHRALYIIVWNAREGQEQNEVEPWLRRVRLRAGRDARTVVVATHCAERLPELDYPQLEQTFPDMLVGSYEVDNRTSVGISKFGEAIGQRAAELPQMGQLISPRWIAARDEILARADSEPQIRYEEFANVCERNGVNGSEIVTLAELMHDLGHIIYYGDDEGLKDIVVLNPEWLTKAISYVLEDKPTRDAGGVLDHTRLKDIWQNRENGPAYPYRYHPYFLRLMEKFDVCYRLEGDALTSLVAQLAPHRRPELPWQAWTKPKSGTRTMALVCRLSEPAPGLIPWLTVRHHRASTGRHWRNGVFLRHPISEYASEALLELHENVDLTVEVRAPSPDLYFNVLRDSIEDLITRRWPGLTYQLLVPCPSENTDGFKCSGLFPLAGVLRLRERGLTSIPCMECAAEFEPSFLLTGFTAPENSLTDQLRRIERDIAGLKGQAAVIAESVRRVLRVVSTEVADCPRLFTLKLEEAAGIDRLRFYQNSYLLTLWCEHPGYWHPWAPARYRLDQSSDWFAKIRPYAMLVFRTLRLVVPLADSIADVLLPQDKLAHMQADLELMQTVVAELPGKPNQDVGGVGLGEITVQLTPAEGEALRAIRAILFEQDRLRAFGGLRRVQAPSGDFLWVCTDHYSEYDPGLPVVP